MSSSLKIATNLSLPLDAVTQTFAILAKRGVGKTYTAAVMVEEMLRANLHVAVADPIGVWWGLRAKADGKSAGLPIVVLGGDHGDIPLEVTAGETIADLVVQEHLSVVLDLSHFRKNESVRFMTAFCEKLYHSNRKPIHLVLDEADAWAPQRPQKGNERLLGAVEDLVRRGRARGIGVTLITQRAAVINKNVLTQSEVLIALRTIAPQDREAVEAWIEVHGTPEQAEEMMTSLPSLPIGTAWFWSPGWLDVFKQVKVRERVTFDSSSTPKEGHKPRQPKHLAPVDLEKLRDRLSSTIERAKLEDPALLRARIAELERELKKEKAKKPEPELKKVEVPVLDKKLGEQLAKQVERLYEIGEKIFQSISLVVPLQHQVKAPVVRPFVPFAPEKRCPPKEKPAPPAAHANGLLKAGERKMLQILAQYKDTPLTRAQLGTLAGFTPSGGTFGNYLGTLKRHGMITESRGLLEIDLSGLAYLGDDYPRRPASPEETLEMWKRSVKAGEAKMLDALVAIYPKSLERSELGEQTGFTASGGTFGNYLGTLKRNGLVETSGNMVKASETLFL